NIPGRPDVDSASNSDDRPPCCNVLDHRHRPCPSPLHGDEGTDPAATRHGGLGPMPQSAGTSQPYRYCPQSGAPVAPGIQVRPDCGARLKQASSPTPQPAPAQAGFGAWGILLGAVVLLFLGLALLFVPYTFLLGLIVIALSVLLFVVGFRTQPGVPRS